MLGQVLLWLAFIGGIALIAMSAAETLAAAPGKEPRRTMRILSQLPGLFYGCLAAFDSATEIFSTGISPTTRSLVIALLFGAETTSILLVLLLRHRQGSGERGSKH